MKVKKGIVLAPLALFIGVALAQATENTEMVPKLVGGEPAATEIGPTKAPIHMGRGNRHKLIVDMESDLDLYVSLLEKNAVLGEVDYGAFRQLIVDEQALGGRSELKKLERVLRDDQDLLTINGYQMETSTGSARLAHAPADLRQRRMADAIANGQGNPGAGMYLVQFSGPVKPEWVEELKATGVDIVTYMAPNAYAVKAAAPAAAKLVKFKAREFVQFVGDHEPAFRLSPSLQDLRTRGSSEDVSVYVQVVDGATADRTIKQLDALATEVIGVRPTLRYRNVEMRVNAAHLGKIAELEDVFSIGPAGTTKFVEEEQAQIVAGNFAANLPGGRFGPTGPGYLGWLASKGFNSSQFGSFAVNIFDNGYLLGGFHEDLPSDRVAFEHQTHSIPDTRPGGHSFQVASILAGFNDKNTGLPYEESPGSVYPVGYNFGLGIAPWARIGGTYYYRGIPNGYTYWEGQAYADGARITNNSWSRADESYYSALAQEFDAIVRDAQPLIAGNQQMIEVFGAGNFSLPGSGGAGGTAKNVISVGASEKPYPRSYFGQIIWEETNDNAHDIWANSSRGPVDVESGDYRVKPDIVAPGTSIASANPQPDSVRGLYGRSSGTSYSAPAVSGGIALLYQDFINKGRTPPSPAMAKAYAMNAATYLTGNSANDTLPSNNQGMGLLALDRMFDGTPRILVDQTEVLTGTGQYRQFNGVITDPTKPFRVTVAWTDAPGPTTGNPAVNNLNLSVRVGGQTYIGNNFSGQYSVPGGNTDYRNNVESVYLPPGTSGPFTITVSGANVVAPAVTPAGNDVNQDFALVAYNASPGLLNNGGFEGGTLSPWVAGSGGVLGTDGFADTGTGYLRLGGVNNGGGIGYQTVTIPAGTSPNLWFSLNVDSEDSETIVYDRFYVEVLDSNNTVLTTLAQFSNTDQTPPGVYVQRGPYSLAQFAGQTVRLRFRAYVDNIDPTTFRVDTVLVN